MTGGELSRRQCPGCREDLPTDAFGANRRRPDGLAYYCKSCFQEVHRASYRRRRAAQGKTVREPRDSPPGMRWCPDCQDHVPLTSFALNRATASGVAGYCRQHQQARIEGSRERRHGSTRDYHLKRRYGISGAEVDDMRDRQVNTCPICRRLLPAKAHVDHDHGTGEVRALLCFTCNAGLGNFSDNTAWMRRAIAYLDGALTAPSRVWPDQVDWDGEGWRRPASEVERLLETQLFRRVGSRA